MNKINVKQYTLEISPILVRKFHDFGVQMTDEFKLLYHGFFTNGKITLTDKFQEVSKDLFNNFDSENKTSLSDDYFENFTPITNTLLDRGQYRIAFNLWNKIMSFVKDWEDSSGEMLHKGSPYYFSAVSAIMSRDFDSAIIAFHLALEEDKKNHQNYKRTPGYYLLTLNTDKSKQYYFKQFVDGMVGFLRDRLDGQGSEQGRYKEHYHAKRAGSLNYEQLREKFFYNDDVNDELKFFFVYSAIRLWHLRVNQVLNRQEEVIAPVIFLHSLSPFLIMLEMLLKIKYPKPKNANKWNYGNVLEKLANDESWTLEQLGDVNDARDTDFEQWIEECLNKNSIEGDFELTYGLRNFSFHKIESQQKLWERFTDILQSTWNCFFKAVETI